MMILNDQGGSMMDVSEDVTACLRAYMGDNQPAVCYAIDSHPMDSRFEIAGDISPTVTSKLLKGSADGPLVLIEKMSNVKCMNPWDPQSKRQYQIDGVYATLHARQNGGGQADGICYAIEGNGARPSHMGRGYHDDGTMYTLNTIEQHGVCYGVRRSCLKGGNGSNGGMPIGENVQPAMTANGCGAVAYAIENHPNDSMISIEDDGIVQSLTSRMGTWRGNTPMVLEVRK